LLLFFKKEDLSLSGSLYAGVMTVPDPTGRFRPVPLREAATTAAAEGDFDQALELLAEYRRRHPAMPFGFLAAIRVARAAKRFDMVRQLAREGAARFPNSGPLKSLHAAFDEEKPGKGEDASESLAAILAPVARRGCGNAKLEYALAGLAALGARFPAFQRIFLEHVTLLRRFGRFAEALSLVHACLESFPESLEFGLKHVAVLDDLGRWQEALQTVTALRANAPQSASIEVAYIQALSRLGRLDEADEACAAALVAFPKDVALHCEYATMASRRGDWQGALVRWEAAQKLFPTRAAIRRGLGGVQLQLASQALKGSVLSEGETGRFFSRFESLGGTNGGCEFGMVQRHFGSASLGLLRWASISPAQLIDGLTRDFAGLGTAENTTLTTLRVSADRDEYIVVDKNYHLGSHTFISTTDAPEDKMLAQTMRRLAFLRDKLLEDLRLAEKVFVYKLASSVEDSVLRDIFAAIRRHGDVTLICVLKACEANPPGSTRVLAEGFFVGYVGYFMNEVSGDVQRFDHAAWTAICQAAIV
jgi:tetratricopeptide (TPR) repeat protein